MARVQISKDAREKKAFVLMPAGRQVIKVTSVEMMPKGNPKNISIRAENADGIEIRNKWNIANDKQEAMFWLFYNLGCGLDADDEGFVDPMAMKGRFAEIEVTHTVLEARVNEETGKEMPERTFANFGRINGNVSGFDGGSAESEDEDTIEFDDDDDVEFDDGEDDDSIEFD